jgi:DNA polymerase-3 subunit delta'
MNANAANALLKSLEEPPPRTVFLLVTHVQGRLLPTIRSRCTRLELQPLSDELVDRTLDSLPEHLMPPASAEQRRIAVTLSEGSPGRALQIMESSGLKLFQDFTNLVARVPGMDYAQDFDFADRLRGIAVLDDYRLFTDLLEQWLSRRIRDAARGLDDWNGILRPERVNAWIDIHRAIVHSIARANALNLDRREVIVQALRLIDDSARA